MILLVHVVLKRTTCTMILLVHVILKRTICTMSLLINRDMASESNNYKVITNRKYVISVHWC